MGKLRLPLAVAIFLSVVGLASWAVARQEALLDVAQGQIPNDTGSDGATKMTIEEQPALAGKALKVAFAAGDSCGDRVARVKNWKQFICLQFDVFNPAKQDVPLTLTVKHRRTTNFQTRVDAPLVVKPGKSTVKLGIDEMVNVNGSAPDLANVERWYIACGDGETPTLYFGSLLLVGDDATAAPSTSGAAAPAAAGPPATGAAGSYRVTGKVGEMPVELTVVPTGPLAAAVVPGATPSATAAAPQEAKAAALVQPSRDQMPNDTGSDTTKMSIDQRPELGGKCLKVVYAGADSFGQTMIKVKDWRPFLTLQFDVFNPGQSTLPMALNIKHKRSTSYPTRIEVPFQLKPGKTSLKFNLDEMANVNGSAADLSQVTHWYVLCQEAKTPPLYFGDFWLVPAGGSVPAPGTAAAAGGPAKPVATDPARLARIRAAKMPADHEAGHVRHARGRRHLLGPGGLPARQPLEPGRRAIGRCIRTRRTSSRRSAPDKPLRYNPDMGFILVPPDQKQSRPEGRRTTRASRTRGRSRFPTTCRSKAGRSAQSATRTTRAGRWTTSSATRGNRGGDRHGDRRRSGQPHALRVLPGEEDRQRLAGGAGVDLRPEDEQAAARRLDLGRRGRPADLPGGRPLRRTEARAASSTPCA